MLLRSRSTTLHSMLEPQKVCNQMCTRAMAKEAKLLNEQSQRLYSIRTPKAAEMKPHVTVYFICQSHGRCTFCLGVNEFISSAAHALRRFLFLNRLYLSTKKLKYASYISPPIFEELGSRLAYVLGYPPSLYNIEFILSCPNQESLFGNTYGYYSLKTMAISAPSLKRFCHNIMSVSFRALSQSHAVVFEWRKWAL